LRDHRRRLRGEKRQAYEKLEQRGNIYFNRIKTASSWEL
jgi:hypothetical protein